MKVVKAVVVVVTLAMSLGAFADDAVMGSGGRSGGQLGSGNDTAPPPEEDGGAWMGGGTRSGFIVAGNSNVTADDGPALGAGVGDAPEGDSPMLGGGVGRDGIMGSGTRIASNGDSGDDAGEGDAPMVGSGVGDDSSGYGVGSNATIVTDDLGLEYLVVKHGHVFAIYALG